MGRKGFEIQAREWQKTALSKWLRSMTGVVEVVTGGGKTVFGMLCVNEFLSERPSGKAVIIAPTLALIDQWAVEIVNAGLFDSDAIAIHAQGESPASASADCHIMTLVAAREAAPLISSQADVILVVDECHRIASHANARALDGEYAATLGLSATPQREYDSLFETEVRPILGEVIFQYTYEEARADGVVAPFALQNIQVPFTAEESSQYEDLTKRIGAAMGLRGKGEDVDELLKRLLRLRAAVASQAKYRVPVAVRVMDDFKGKRAIVFHERTRDADAIAELLSARGHRVAVYHSGLGPALRRSELDLYRNGMVDVLVTCRALDEGLDVPDTEMALIASSTASRRQRIQRVGRALRPKSNGATALVVTLFASRQERERLEADSQTVGAIDITWSHAEV